MINKEYFIFIDDEDWKHIVLWDPKKFEKVYTELQNEYWNNNNDYGDFYDVLWERLKNIWIEFYREPTILHHNNLDFNQK